MGQNSAARPDLHVNFKLARSGDAIGLYAPDGFTLIDSVTFSNQFSNISEGRFTDGAATRYMMAIPTPGGPNAINCPPYLSPIPERTIRLGQTVSFTASATDADRPAQALSFSLGGSPPPGASITSFGLFTWTPAPAQAPSTNTITVLLTDDGTPSLTVATTFTVFVRLPPVAAIGNFGGGHLTISFDSITGRTYRVDWKEHLEDPAWTPLAPPVLATGTSVIATDQTHPGSQRFYRVVQID